jgi:hypothetical protein
MLYNANNAGTDKCVGRLLSKDYLIFDQKMTKESADFFTKTTGYSDCKTVSQSKDHQETTCSKPYLYKSISTSNMAKCHKFMKEQKITR